MLWTVDPVHTTISFRVRHLGLSSVRGQFTRFRGDLELDDDASPTSGRGSVEIEAASLTTGNEQRDGDLRGPNFLDVENHPTVRFALQSVTRATGDTFTVIGDLTIRGVTRRVMLTYEHAGTTTDPYGQVRLGGSLSGVIERSDWGLTWNVPLPGGRLFVGDRATIEVEGQVVQAREAAAAAAGAEASST